MTSKDCPVSSWEDGSMRGYICKYSLPTQSPLLSAKGKIANLSVFNLYVSPIPNSQLHHLERTALFVARRINLSFLFIISFRIFAVLPLGFSGIVSIIQSTKTSALRPLKNETASSTMLTSVWQWDKKMLVTASARFSASASYNMFCNDFLPAFVSAITVNCCLVKNAIRLPTNLSMNNNNCRPDE